MYSVEDLLISHGYKLPMHTTSSAPTPAPTSSSHKPPSSSPPSYSRHHEFLDNRSGSGTLSGPGMPYGNGSESRKPHGYASGCSNNINEPRDRGLCRREAKNRCQMDTHSLGELLTSDSGFCNGTRGPQSQAKDLSYWRRRGQDFSVLLGYADHRETHGGGKAGYGSPEGAQKARGQEWSAEERQRAAKERQHWAAQAQARVQAQVRSKEREAALHHLRMANERKCQSFGTEEWRPGVNFGRQLSQCVGGRWAQEQLHARTPEGMVVHPRAKVKSQSLPRMLQPESLQYVDIDSSHLELFRRVNGQPPLHHNLYRPPRWLENGRPGSANQLSMTSKPRFTRPPRPPSYEMHQQIRGSCEMLSGRESVTLQARDRTPLPISRTVDPQLDYFAQDSGPPGYIAPPSYKRVPIMRGRQHGYGEIAVDYRYRGDLYQQIHVAPDGSHWIRHPAGSWPDPQRERSVKQLYPVYTTQEHPGGGIQYIPFDDPRIRHISSAMAGNSLTDADKIRHIRNELPSVTVSEPASSDSAFLPPPLGPFIAAKLGDDANQTSSSDFDNDNTRWHSDLHKAVHNLPATDQNCNRYAKNQRPSSSPSSAFQAPLSISCSHQGTNSDQVFAETITQVKTIVPDLGPENTKRRVSETIFCLVSVPVHTPINISRDFAADQNNNETTPSLTVTNTDTFAVGLKESHNVRSKSVNEMPIKPHYSHFYTSSTSLMRNYKRAPLRKEIIDAWALQARQDKELCYAGSWPGNQYRNQETQTGSPSIEVKSPKSQSPPSGQEPLQSVSDTNLDSVVGPERSSSYGYPIAGQKNLHPSSNSAFSRLSLSRTQPTGLETCQQDSWEENGWNQVEQPSSPRKSNSNPAETAEQVTFGQFLLKPVNRRPCDAIGQLEIINNEMEDTISKKPNVGQCIDDLDVAKKRSDRFQSAAHFTASPEPCREGISLSPMHIENPNIVRSTSLASTADLGYMDIKSAFTRPQVNNIPSTNETNSNLDCRNCGLQPLLTLQNEPNRFYRQDIPVPQESLLRDVGLTVYTETPGGPGEPMQRSLSVPSPRDHKEFSESVHQSLERRTALVKNSDSPEHNSNKELQAEAETERTPKSDNFPLFRGEVNLTICRTRSESSRSPQKEGSSHITRLTREVSFWIKGDDGNGRYAISEPLIYKNDSTMADKHLENLLIREKANSLPTEDLSNLYVVKYANGIPENESIEQRAARILGISVPVHSLGVAEKQDDLDNVVKKLHSQGKETQPVIGECEDESPMVSGAETEEVKGTESVVDHVKGDRQKHSTNHSNDEGTEIQSLGVVANLPEVPPHTLPPSLPTTPDDKLPLSPCSVQRRLRGGASTLIESLHDKLTSSTVSFATSLGRSTPHRMARLKELDSVSRIRRLSLKGSDFGEVDSRERDGDRQEGEPQEVTREEVVEQRVEENNEKTEEDRRKGEENPFEHETARETHDRLGDPEGHCKPKREVNEAICEKEPIQEEKVEETKVDVEFKTAESNTEVEPQTVEHDKERPLETVRVGQNTSEATEDAVAQKLPKPKQRTKLQKPPLLPKPRSVPKKEISLPLSFSTGICGPSNNVDEEMLSVSESYDPSQVERV
ncbi:jcad [Pungitius sinensis]